MGLAKYPAIEQLFLCPICKKEYKSLASLKTHFNKNHVMVRCPVCGGKLSTKGSGYVHHFSRKKDKPHLAFVYLLIRSSRKKVFWKEVCEVATAYFATSSNVLFSLIREGSGEHNSKLIDKRGSS
jgi:hypothetical protein